MGPRVVGLLLAAGRGRRFVAAGQAPASVSAGSPVRREVPDGATPEPGQKAPSPDKLLASVGGRPVARLALEALAGGCDTVIAVVRPDASAALRGALAGARIVECAQAELGMGHSLATAARAAVDDAPDVVLVLPADMPWLEPRTVRAIVEAAGSGEAAARGERIVVPALPDGRRGHPVAFGATHLAALSRLVGDRGARGLLDAHPVQVVTVDDAGILRDVDTPSDLQPS